MKSCPLDGLTVSNADESAALIRAVLANVPGPAHDIVAMNAGAAIYAADVEPTLRAGVDRARVHLADGSAALRLERFVSFCRSLQQRPPA